MRNRLFLLSMVFVAGSAFGLSAATQNSSEIEIFKGSDGTESFLIPLSCDLSEEAGPVDAAVVVDLSASQLSSQVREEAARAVESLISNLPEGSRVKVYRSDNETVAIPGSESFVSADSEFAAAAVDELAKITPLGAMDLKNAVKTAGNDLIAEENGNRKSIVFIGRGISTSSFFDKNEAAVLTRELVENRVTFSAFANGAVTNNNALAALAYQTGGYFVDPRISEGEEAGSILAESEKAAVCWPEGSILSEIKGASALYPESVPPLRSDRETFILGSGNGIPQDLSFSVPVSTSDDEESTLDLSFTVSESSGNQYIAQMVETAEKDGGLSLPITDRALLRDYQAALQNQNEMAFDLAQQAKENGDSDDALYLTAAVQGLTGSKESAENSDSAGSEDAESAFEEAGKILESQEKDGTVSTDNKGIAYNPINSGSSNKPEDAANLLDASHSNVRLKTAQLKGEIKAVIDNARKLVTTDPEVAIQNIKLAISTVQSSSFVSDADREELLSTLEANAREIERQKFAKEKRDLVAMQNNAKLTAIASVVNQRVENQKKVEEIMKRFNSLIAEEHYMLAADVAGAATDLIDDLALPTQAANVARLTDAYSENQYLRKYRRIRFLDVLMSVERSHIPTSDEPPILYPDADTWFALSKARKEKYSDASLFTQPESRKKIVKALDDLVDVKVEGGEDGEGRLLTDWIDEVRRERGINIVFDRSAIDEESETSLEEMEITDSLLSVSLRTALNLNLRRYNLVACIRDEYLFITTKDTIDSLESSDDLWREINQLRYYPVSDLTLVPSSGSMSGLNGSSGMGGGMSGGMNGNRGGMGGGMGGMNFSLPAKADARPAKVEVKSDKSSSEGTGTLMTVAASLDEKWDNYFKANAPKLPEPSSEGTVEEREAERKEVQEKYENDLHQFQMGFMKEVNDLMKEKNFDEAASALKSALRADMAASWMYEALAIALIQSNAPQAEVERAVLSAAEFADDPVTVLGVAGYLETIGSNQKALQLYREVSKFDPARPEPYIRSLALAKETGDEDAQKWVTLGIASGAWEGRLEADVWDEGLRLSEELIEKMKSEGREEELAAYQKDLAEALVRDIVIEVRWTGDAEIDIAVKEPVNTICWFAQPRTGAGGILRTEAVEASSLEEQQEGERCKVYTCPMAFSGNYDVAVSRTWGELPQGKVTVNIITGIGTDQEKTATYPLELKEGKAGFSVLLENGRRSEEVKKELLTASALVDQLRVKSNKEISERVKAYQDKSAKAAAKRAAENQSYSASYSAADQSQSKEASESDFETPELQYTLGTDSGYMPVISTVNVGAQMQPNLGITPDRRYVLISPNAQFTGLLRMFQYNTSSGGGMSGMGGGGGGMSGGFGGTSGGTNSIASMRGGMGGNSGMQRGGMNGMNNSGMNSGNRGGMSNY